MRRFINTDNKVALENIQVDLNNKYWALESEENQEYEEAVEISHEIERESDEAEKCTDVAACLSQVGDVLEVKEDKGESLTEAETQLIQVAGDMATAGENDVTSEDIMPATESFQDGKYVRSYAAESIKEKIKTIWENIKRWFKDIFAKIVRFFRNLFGAVKSHKEKMKVLKSKLDKLYKEKPTVEIEGLVIRGNTQLLYNDGQWIDSVGGLADKWNDTSKTVDKLLGELGNITKTTITIFNDLEGLFKFDKGYFIGLDKDLNAVEDNRQAIGGIVLDEDNIIKIFDQGYFKALKGRLGPDEKLDQFPGKNANIVTGKLLGGSGVYMISDPIGTNEKAKDVMDRFLSVRFEVVHEKLEDKKDSVEFGGTVQINDLRNICTDTIKILDQIDYLDSKLGKELDKEVSKFSKLVDSWMKGSKTAKFGMKFALGNKAQSERIYRQWRSDNNMQDNQSSKDLFNEAMKGLGERLDLSIVAVKSIKSLSRLFTSTIAPLSNELYRESKGVTNIVRYIVSKIEGNSGSSSNAKDESDSDGSSFSNDSQAFDMHREAHDNATRQAQHAHDQAVHNQMLHHQF